MSLLAISSLAAWLCGNLYEELVIAPNFAFGDTRAAMVAFRELFRVSNPTLFYVPIGAIVIGTCVAHVVATRRQPARRAMALGATGCVLVAGLLTAWIVAHVNLRLFYGTVTNDVVQARSLAREWLVLNGIRIGLVALAIHFERRAPRQPLLASS